MKRTARVLAERIEAITGKRGGSSEQRQQLAWLGSLALWTITFRCSFRESLSLGFRNSLQGLSSPSVGLKSNIQVVTASIKRLETKLNQRKNEQRCASRWDEEWHGEGTPKFHRSIRRSMGSNTNQIKGEVYECRSRSFRPGDGYAAWKRASELCNGGNFRADKTFGERQAGEQFGNHP